jgi:3-deoxy-D-manno-octulosonate 8-phosphate phosphatase (KDO 8-P phosphatase)
MGVRIITLMIKHFVLDVDGVLTDGRFHYSCNGKIMKVFGPHDNDGLKMIRDKVAIQFITADARGFEISYRRIWRDMDFPLTLVSEKDRYAFVSALGFEETAFMGDGYHDAPVMRDCALSFAPSSARKEAKAAADIVTESAGGNGAVMDACLYLKEFHFDRV